MNYTENYVVEYLAVDREWMLYDSFDNEADAVTAFNRRCARDQRRSFRIRRVMSVVIAQCSRGV